MQQEQTLLRRYRRHTDWVAQLHRARIVRDFNRDWEYQAGLIPADPDWIPVTLPHDYSIEGAFSAKHATGPSGGYVRSGVVWYQKRFLLSAEYQNKKIFLHFDGISANSEVWINGTLLKQHPYGYSPVHVDITREVRLNGDNLVQVKVDTSLQPFSRFYQGTGINRGVELVAVSQLHFDDFGVRVTTTLSDGGRRAAVQVDAAVRVAQYEETVWHDFGKEPNSFVQKNCEITAELWDGDTVVARESSTITVPEFSRKTATLNLQLEEPKLWCGETPHLYYLHTAVSADGVLLDDCVTPVGVREIAYGTSGLRINGVMTKLKGVCLHQDWGLFGSSVPAKIWIKKLCMMQRMGANAVRTAHHPFPNEFYDLCDLMGLYVMDEAFDEWNKGWERDASEQPYGKNKYGYYQYFEAWSAIDVQLMVRRDRNHPSVILWSMGNEIPDFYYEEGIASLKRLMDCCRKEDATRPITIGAEGQYRLPLREEIMGMLDIAGYNYINLKYPDYYETIHRQYPKRVMVGSETFFDPEHWDFILKNDYAVGQFLWAGYDYLGEAGANNDNNPVVEMGRDFAQIVHKKTPNYGGTGTDSFGSVDCKVCLMHGLPIGMADIIDTPRGEYFYRQSLWAAEPVIHLGVKVYEWDRQGMWKIVPALDSWNYTAGEEKTVYCFTNCERIELYLNGECIAGREKNPHEVLPLELPVLFVPGRLEAVGYRGGIACCRHALQTVGALHHLELDCEETELRADGNDYAVITVTLADESGNWVFAEERTLTATVLGDPDCAVFYRAGNGSLWNQNSYCDSITDTFNGKAAVVVKSGMKTGTVTVLIQSHGLDDQRMELDVRHVLGIEEGF